MAVCLQPISTIIESGARAQTTHDTQRHIRQWCEGTQDTFQNEKYDAHKGPKGIYANHFPHGVVVFFIYATHMGRITIDVFAESTLDKEGATTHARFVAGVLAGNAKILKCQEDVC